MMNGVISTAIGPDLVVNCPRRREYWSFSDRIRCRSLPTFRL